MTWTYTPSATLPVSLAEFKAHLHYSGDDEDGDLTGKLIAAVQGVETATGRVLISSTAVLTLETWPSEDYIELPGGQTSAITTLKYTDSAGAVTTWGATNYKLVRAYAPLVTPTRVIPGRARLQLAYSIAWPSVTLDTGEPIEITYPTGFKDADSVPWQLKAAILLDGAHMYRNRESVTLGNTAVESKALARGYEDLIAPFRIWQF